jgi:hypothetical protein
MSATPVKLCQSCHTAGDAQVRLQFSLAKTGEPAGVFSGHHPQGDEFSHSPHNTGTCYMCHDPHKSVWNASPADPLNDGVLYAEDAGRGNMCQHCHNKKVRGAMGPGDQNNPGIDLECTECHMPIASEGTAGANVGAGSSHIFRIDTTGLSAAQNTSKPDSSGKTWWNTPNGDASLTVDLVCTQCHTNMTLAQMTSAAKSIHRAPGLVDLTVNGSDGAVMADKANPVSVDFSVLTDATTAGVKADWWINCNGPKGLSSWNGTKWVSGNSAWRKGYALPAAGTLMQQNVFDAMLTPGYPYTYTMQISVTQTQTSVVKGKKTTTTTTKVLGFDSVTVIAQ